MRHPLEFLLALSALLGPALPAAAGEIRVPADQPDLTAALAAAAPGDVIRIQTSADQAPASGASILIDKPITIVGEPVCKIELKGAGLPPDGGLKLAGFGPGSLGEVVLIGIEIDYLVGFEDGKPALSGGGFSAVRLYDCTIRHDNLTPTGTITKAFPAVRLTDLGGIDELTVVGCDLLGGSRYADTCIPTFVHGDGAAGIDATGASVLVIDSTVTGGSGGLGSVEYALPACPSTLDAVPGAGGPGVVADELHVWNSTITGGSGAQVLVDPVGFCNSPDFIACGTKPDGAPFVVSGTLAVQGCSRLTQASPRAPLGGTWQVDWDPVASGCLPLGVGPGVPAFLFVDLAAPIDPIAFAGSWVYLNPGTAFLAASFPSDLPSTVSAPVPALPALAGVPVSAQVLVGSGELSGPVSGLLVP